MQALASLGNETVLDGEIVALDESGKPSFHRLQDASPDTPLTFFAFDLLMAGGHRPARSLARRTTRFIAERRFEPARSNSLL